MAQTPDFIYYSEILARIFLSFSGDVENVANTFYIEKESKITNYEKIFSPYLTVDQIELKCILEKIKEQLTSQLIPLRAEVCKISGIISHEKMQQTKNFEQYKINVNSSETYAVKIRKMNKFFLEFEPELRSLSLIADKKELLLRCNYTDISNYYFLKADVFTNELLISLFLNNYYTDPNINTFRLNGYAKHYIGTILNYPNERYSLELMDYYPSTLSKIVYSSNFSPLTEIISGFNEQGPYTIASPKLQVLINILIQVLCNLHFLQNQLQFLHGNLILDNIGIDLQKPTVVNYAVENKAININLISTFSIFLLDFSTSSLAFSNNYYGETKGIKIYPISSTGSILSSVLNFVFPFSPKIEEIGGESVFILDNSLNLTMLNDARNSGINFPFAFDVYVFMISIMLDRTFSHKILTDVNLKKDLWDVLWVEKKDAVDAYRKIYTIITGNKESNLENVLSILRGKKIRCNILEKLLTSLSILNQQFPT